MRFVNLTPHVVRLNSGTEFPPSGQVARVSTAYTPFDENGVASVQFGAVQGLPSPADGTIYIVSALVAQAARAAFNGGSTVRQTVSDLVSPATGHPDCVRRDGQVWSVPGFVRA